MQILYVFYTLYIHCLRNFTVYAISINKRGSAEGRKSEKNLLPNLMQIPKQHLVKTLKTGSERRYR